MSRFFFKQLCLKEHMTGVSSAGRGMTRDKDEGSVADEGDALRTGAGLDLFSILSEQRPDPLPGRLLGDYRVFELIAEGGMSRVYRGERADGSFERQVAIKVSPLSGYSDSLRDSFVREQRTLASLSHPNITQLYDARISDDGLPYIVMELVEGVDIRAHCQTHGLDLRQIVELLVQIIDAIAYAHGALVVHRDIKPSNVLIDETGHPKLLDFGIAKLLGDEEGVLTRATPLTPRYASPEQLLGRQITTASDIYQIGLLGCELLTGELPTTAANTEEAVQRAAEQRPVTLNSRTRSVLPRELALIIEQCLRASPEERYQSASILKADLLAYLHGYPVSAAGQSAGYRLRKFTARNFAATVIAAGALVILVGGASWYTWQLSQARASAERQAETANRLLAALSSMVADTFEGLIDHNAEQQVGSAAIVEGVLEDTVELIQAELDLEPTARGELLRVRGRMEEVLGDYASAERSLWEAQQILSTGADPQTSMELLLERTGVQLAMIDVDAARRLLEQARTSLDLELIQPETYAEFHLRYAEIMFREGRFDESLETIEAALELAQSLQTPDPQLIANIYLSKANVNQAAYDHETQMESAEQALRAFELIELPNSSRLVAPLRHLGWAQTMLGDLDAAEQSLERAMRIARSNFGDLHPLVSDTHNSLGMLAYYRKRPDLAIEHVSEQIRISGALYGNDSPSVLNAMGNLGMLLTDTGEMEKAAAIHQQQIAMLDENTPEHGMDLYTVLTNEARRLSAIGDYESAAEHHERSRLIRAEIFGPESIEVADAEDDMALALYNLGQHERAERWFRAGLEKYRLAEGESSSEYQNQRLYEWRYDLLRGDLTTARDKLHELMMEDVNRDEVDAIWPVHMFTDLAAINLELGELDRARQALDWAARGAATAPIHPSAYYAALVEAEFQLHSGNLERARSAATTALKGFRDRYPLHVDRITRAEAVLTASRARTTPR
jgi:serine/threonine-protein kinase